MTSSPQLIVTALLVCAGIAAASEQQLQRHQGLVYASPGGHNLKLDLYLPAAQEGVKRPVVIWIHGGAWRAGDRHRCPAVFLVESGYAVASVDYRYSSEATFPAQILDCKAAVRWLRAHAAEYHLDPDHIGVWGSSAGGHLAALLGTTDGVKALEPDDAPNAKVSARVQAVCDFFGPADLVALGRTGIPEVDDPGNNPVTQLLGGPVADHFELATLASPVFAVTADDAPFLIMHGDRDALVPLDQSQLLAARLREAGVEVTLEVQEGKGHGFGGPQIAKRVQQFFDAHLKH